MVLHRHYLPNFEAGIYAALVTAGKIIFFVLSPIAVVLLPIVSRKSSKPELSRKDLLTALAIALGLGICVLIIYFGLARIIITTLFTSKFDQATMFLPWFGLAMLGYSLANIFGNFLIALNRSQVVSIAILGVLLEVGSIYLFHATLWQVVWGLTVVFWTLAIILFSLSWHATRQKTQIIGKIWN